MVPAQYARLGSLVAALLSLFWFPWPLTVSLMVLSGFLFPPSALLLGVIAEVLYYPGQGYFWATLTGACIMMLSIAVRHFMKTRIM